MKKITLITFLFIGLQSFAQLNFNSPYSIFALGDVRAPGTVYNHSMGGVGISSGNALFINNINPAMLSRNHTMIFDMSLTGSYKQLKTDGGQETSFGANFDGLNLAFPVSRKISTAIGINPFSARSYDFNTEQIVDESTSANNTYTGSGGLTKINWSTGYKFWQHKRRKTNIALGLEVAYIFGPMEEESASSLIIDGATQQYTSSAFTRQSFSGFNFKPGLLFRREFGYSNKLYKKYYYDKETNDTTLYFTKEKKLFSGVNIENASKKMVIGKYMVLFQDQEEVVVSKLFTNRKLSKYFSNALKKVKPVDVGVYLKSIADQSNREEILREFKLLLVQLQYQNYTPSDTSVFSKSYAKHYLKKGNGTFFNLGAIYNFQREFGGKTFYSINQYDPQGARVYADTIINNERTSFTMPSTLEFGISFDKPTPAGYKKNGEPKTSVWSVALDYSQYNWSEYKNPADLFSYDNSYSVRFGGEICPDIAQKRSRGFGSQMFFRAGAYYNKAPHRVDGQELRTLGFNAGIGFPMFGAKQLPRYINIMFGYGKRGLSKNIIIQENYYNFSISFSFNNKFSKRKAGL